MTGPRATGPRGDMTAVRFLAQHLAVGLGAAALFGGLLILADIGGLRQLAMADENGWLYILLLFFGLAVTFGSAAMGVSVMNLGRERDRR
jgi:hypothetical protein